MIYLNGLRLTVVTRLLYLPLQKATIDLLYFFPCPRSPSKKAKARLDWGIIDERIDRKLPCEPIPSKMLVQLGQDHLKRFPFKGVFAPSVRRFIHNDDALCVALSGCKRRSDTPCITLLRNKHNLDIYRISIDTGSLLFHYLACSLVFFW